MSLFLCVLFVNQLLSSPDEETLEQIYKGVYMQSLHGFAGYSSKPPFGTSRMVNFYKQFSREDFKPIKELIAEPKKAMVKNVVATDSGDDDLACCMALLAVETTGNTTISAQALRTNLEEVLPL